MTWLPWGNYAQRNGDFSICKVKVNGQWICQLWHISPDLRIAPSVMLGQGTYQEMLDSFEREKDRPNANA